MHDHQLEGLEKFVAAYSNEPKASLTWISHLVHDESAPLYNVDDQLHAYFTRLAPKVCDEHC